LSEDNGSTAEDDGENKAVGGENGYLSWENPGLDIAVTDITRVREENTNTHVD
jgi:hypothetical protein